MNRNLLLKIVKAISARAKADALTGRMNMPEDIADDADLAELYRADLAELYRDEYIAEVHSLDTANAVTLKAWDDLCKHVNGIAA